MSAPVLEVRQLDKRFGATHALRGASLSLARGEIVALLGENGAGKSTLTKIISGEVAPDAGQILVDGQAAHFGATADAIAAGISRVPQELQVFPSLTVHENLYAGSMPERRLLPGVASVRRDMSRRNAGRLLETFDIVLPLDRLCGTLTFAQKQLVMLLRALTHDVKVLILDEPTAALEYKEVQLLFRVVRELARRGVAVLYITHRLSELREISSRAILMRDGTVVREVASGQYGDVCLSDDLGGHAPLPADRRDAVAGAGQETVSIPLFGQATRVRRGEVTGFSGLLGSGVESLLIDAFKALDRGARPRAGYISGERGTQVFYDASILRNLCAPHLKMFSVAGHFNEAAARRVAAGLIRAFDIRPGDPDRPMRELSGGNQQKVLLARWFLARMDVLLLAEPTAGVDVGAKLLIQKIIDDYRREGGAVLLSSTDYDELATLCDRIVPIVKGVPGTPMDRGNGFNADEIRHALGVL